MGLVTVKTFDNGIDAHLLKSKLESEEVVCYLFDENIVGLNPLYNITFGGTKLKINEADNVKVKSILDEISGTPYADERNKALECTKCNSYELIGDYKSMRGIKGVSSAIVSFAFLFFQFTINQFISVRLVTINFRCEMRFIKLRN